METNTADTRIASLVEALCNPWEELRLFAMRRLVNQGADAVPALVQALNCARGNLQMNAAIALVTMG